MKPLWWYHFYGFVSKRLAFISEPPPTPDNLTIVEITSRSVRVAWALEAASPVVDRIVLQWKEQSGEKWQPAEHFYSIEWWHCLKNSDWETYNKLIAKLKDSLCIRPRNIFWVNAWLRQNVSYSWASYVSIKLAAKAKHRLQLIKAATFLILF